MNQPRPRSSASSSTRWSPLPTHGSGRGGATGGLVVVPDIVPR